MGNTSIETQKAHERVPIMSQGVALAIVVFLAQVPLVIAFAVNWIQIHPIVFVLPLIGFLNGKVEGRSKEGLGLRVAGVWRSLLLALFFTFCSLICWLLIFRLEGIAIQFPRFEVDLVSSLAVSFLISVFVLALFEEMTCRGYMQTRLQEAWGFRGVVLAALLFGALHMPSAIFDYEGSLANISFRFLISAMVGFGFGVIFWHTKSILTTTAVHGLNNFAYGALMILTRIPAQDLLLRRPLVSLGCLAGQVTLLIVLSKLMFGKRQAEVEYLK
jgi:membrane protease YdiL (CAAX protease family)